MYNLELFKSHATREDWDNMIATLPETFGKFFLLNGDKEYCPVGWMGHCQGINDQWIGPQNNRLGRIYSDIAHYWGLSVEELRSIWSLNDTTGNRSSIVELLRRYAERA